MELPEDVLILIKEYSKPATNPKWRTLRIMPNITFRGEYYLIYLTRRDKLNSAPFEDYIRLNVFYKPQFSAWHYERLFQPKDVYYI
jgi:hypothetical protein